MEIIRAVELKLCLAGGFIWQVPDSVWGWSSRIFTSSNTHRRNCVPLGAG